MSAGGKAKILTEKGKHREGMYLSASFATFYSGVFYDTLINMTWSQMQKYWQS